MCCIYFYGICLSIGVKSLTSFNLRAKFFFSLSPLCRDRFPLFMLSFFFFSLFDAYRHYPEYARVHNFNIFISRGSNLNKFITRIR